MTVIINSIWGGRTSQIVDGHISQVLRGRGISVLDKFSTKACVLLCSNALMSIAYTGVAIAHGLWMDKVIVNTLAHRKLSDAMIQPGSPHLSRPVHSIIYELSRNLNGKLNSDPTAIRENLRLSIIGWHLNKLGHTPFAWELRRGPLEEGKRLFKQKRYNLRHCKYSKGLHAETLGDPGTTIDNEMRAITQEKNITHDGIERRIKKAVSARAAEIATVGSGCLAIQLDPANAEGQVQFTNYPGTLEEPMLKSAWVLTPSMICAPGWQSTAQCSYSECGQYLLGGFSDVQTNLKVVTRLPIEGARIGGVRPITYGSQPRQAV